MLIPPHLEPIRITQDTEKPPLRYALRAAQDAVFRIGTYSQEIREGDNSKELCSSG